MNTTNCILLTVLLILFGILFLNRYVSFDGFRDTMIQRCGVEMAPCPHPLRCMNGFCRSQDHPQLYDRNPLPVVP